MATGQSPWRRAWAVSYASPVCDDSADEAACGNNGIIYVNLSFSFLSNNLIKMSIIEVYSIW